jgi:hypothetical protein
LALLKIFIINFDSEHFPICIMWLSEIFELFIEKSPVTVMVRAMMEVVLAPEKLDELFEQTAQTGYTRELLFSTLVKMMTQVVCSIHQSIGSVYKAMSAEIGVSKTAVYDKLNRLEPSVSQALVRYSALQMATLIHQMGGQLPAVLPKYRLKILDGNGLGATEHRLKVLRNTRSGALPGKSLVVLDPALGLAIDIFPCEDGHAQERSLFSPLLETVETGDLWIGDRNFCTTGLVFGIENKQAAFIIRQHENLPWQETSELVEEGRIEGGVVFSQTGVVAHEGQELCCRRVVVQLDQPTRDGETYIALLTNLPETEASSLLVAHYNLFSCLKAVLGSVHGTDKIEGKLSYYYLADELEGTYRGMMIALPPEQWQDLRSLSLTQFSALLQDWAGSVNLEAFTSSKRKPKKTQPKPPYDPRHPHVSTPRLLAEKKKVRASPNR